MINTTLCYLEQDDCYLMMHRTKKKNDANQGKWIGIGGKFEEGESPDDCLLREVKEETNLQLTQYQFRGIVTFVSDKYGTEHMHLFTASGFVGELCTNCCEGELKWIAKDTISSLSLWEGDKIFLRLLQTESSFFTLKLCYQGDSLVSAIFNGTPLQLTDFL